MAYTCHSMTALCLTVAMVALQRLLNVPQLELKICSAETTAKPHNSGANWGMFSKLCNTSLLPFKFAAASMHRMFAHHASNLSQMNTSPAASITQSGCLHALG